MRLVVRSGQDMDGAVCPVCGKTNVQVTPAGRLRTHTKDHEKCRGSGRQARLAAPLADATASEAAPTSQGEAPPPVSGAAVAAVLAGLLVMLGLVVWGVVALVGSFGEERPTPEQAQRLCREFEPRLGSVTSGEYYDAVYGLAEREGFDGLDLQLLMQDYCPRLTAAAEDVIGDGPDAVLGRSEPESPDSEPTGDAFTCEERYAMADSDIFTEEEQESLRMAVDVDCNPERVDLDGD